MWRNSNSPQNDFPTLPEHGATAPRTLVRVRTAQVHRRDSTHSGTGLGSGHLLHWRIALLRTCSQSRRVYPGISTGTFLKMPTRESGATRTLGGVTAQVVSLFVVQQLGGGGITVKHPQLQHTETSGLGEVCHRPSTLHRSETHSHPAAAARHGAHTALKAARAAKFHRTAHSRRPGGSLPFSSSDTVEGSAHGNNPENRARKASRKNSDMFSESGL